MRPRRSTKQAAFTLAVVVPTLVLATACGGGEGEIVEVTGITSCIDVQDSVDTGEGMGFRDAIYECTMDLSDERLVGVATTGNSCDFTDDGDVTVGECRGTSLITNDGGTWEGTFTGTTTWSAADPAHVHHIDLVYLGTGGYEGLRFVAEMDGIGYPWDVTGRIEAMD